jgi:hypothetical protein
MPASLKLGARRSVNNDSASLKAELDSLRSYRDVLHDTMKGLVEKAQGKLTAEDTPELVSALALVAESLAALVNASKAPPAPEIAPACNAEREEADRERVAREAAEACVPAPRHRRWTAEAAFG